MRVQLERAGARRRRPPSAPADGLPVLWYFALANFSEKVRWALDFKQIPHVGRSLFPAGPRAMRFSRRGTVPVLDLDGERIVDSTRIIAALERRWPDPPLYPADEAERRRALELEDFFDEEAGHEMRRALFYEARRHPRYFSALLVCDRGPWARAFVRAVVMPLGRGYATRRYGISPDDVAEAHRKLAAALDRITAEAGPNGYMVGDSFSVADLTAASLLYFLAQPAELKDYRPEPPRLELLDSFRTHPALDWIREIYSRHRGSPGATVAAPGTASRLEGAFRGCAG